MGQPECEAMMNEARASPLVKLTIQEDGVVTSSIPPTFLNAYYS